MEPPLGLDSSNHYGQALAHKRAEAVRKHVRADHFSHPSNRPAPLILNRQGEPREGDNLRTAPNPSQTECDCDTTTGYRAPCSRAARSPGPLWADATPAPERFARLRRLSLGRCFCRPCPSPARAALPSASGFGRFPPCVGERKTLTNPLTL